jgi:UDP-2-acetamido-2,6-beta-L-arabino-hexul-4-ose reductase
MNNKKKVKLGITGQSGLLGTNLYNELGLYPERFERIPFNSNYFTNPDLLVSFAEQCDTIIHFAAVMRHSDGNELYKINIELVTKLITALIKKNIRPHIIFSSSIQEKLDNSYGKSKSDGRHLFEKWANEYHASFTNVIIPNVFGPFGRPNYNSFIATFCYKLTHDEKPKIIIDDEINLIYVTSLCKHILADIENVYASNFPIIKEKNIPPDFTQKVSEILAILMAFKEQYFDKGIIPVLHNKNEINLFNTFRSYIEPDHCFPVQLKK